MLRKAMMRCRLVGDVAIAIRERGQPTRPSTRSPSSPDQVRGRLSPSPTWGSGDGSISVLSQDQIDHASPFAPPRWIPAYAGMTVVVQSTHRGRGDGSGGEHFKTSGKVLGCGRGSSSDKGGGASQERAQEGPIEGEGSDDSGAGKPARRRCSRRSRSGGARAGACPPHPNPLPRGGEGIPSIAPPPWASPAVASLREGVTYICTFGLFIRK